MLQAPLLYGGLGCHPIHAHHVVEKLILFLHHICENGQIKEAMLASMGTTQLECGMSVPFFTLPLVVWYPLMTETWITHLWNECSTHGIQIKFHPDTFWVPKAPHQKDICIMEEAAK